MPISAYPWSAWSYKKLTLAEYAALKDTDLTAAVFTAMAKTLVIGSTSISDLANVMPDVTEFLPGGSDDDNPDRPLNSRAVVHEKGYEDWTASFILDVDASSKELTAGREQLYLLCGDVNVEYDCHIPGV